MIFFMRKSSLNSSADFFNLKDIFVPLCLRSNSSITNFPSPEEVQIYPFEPLFADLVSIVTSSVTIKTE